MVVTGNERVGLFNVDGTYFAIGNMCTHVGAPLHEGIVEGTEVACALHRARFDLRTGKALSAPAPSDVASYRVRVEGDEVQIEVP